MKAEEGIADASEYLILYFVCMSTLNSENKRDAAFKLGEYIVYYGMQINNAFEVSHAYF